MTGILKELFFFFFFFNEVRNKRYHICARYAIPLGTLHNAVIVEIYRLNAVFCDDLYQNLFHHVSRYSPRQERRRTYPLEINRKPSLEFIGAHLQNLHALFERNIGMVMLVQGRQAVVSAI